MELTCLNNPKGLSFSENDRSYLALGVRIGDFEFCILKIIDSLPIVNTFGVNNSHMLLC
jgi:hypothetical protein